MNLNFTTFRIAEWGSSKMFRPRGSSSVTNCFVTDHDEGLYGQNTLLLPHSAVQQLVKFMFISILAIHIPANSAL